MPKCKECKFFKSKEGSQKGDCFGHEVDAEMDTNNCPTKNFQPKGE